MLLFFLSVYSTVRFPEILFQYLKSPKRCARINFPKLLGSIVSLSFHQGFCLFSFRFLFTHLPDLLNIFTFLGVGCQLFLSIACFRVTLCLCAALIYYVFLIHISNIWICVVIRLSDFLSSQKVLGNLNRSVSYLPRL